jgi:hypothetical protein
LPLLPAIRFFIGIATWLLTVFEAIVSFPLVILGAMRTEDEGLLAHARQGFNLILQMMLRPVLMIFGMIAAILVFDVLYRFVTWTVWTALLDITADSGQMVGSGIQGVLELTAYVLLWTFLVYMSANIAFRAITLIPDRVLVWVTQQGGTSVRVSTDAPAMPPMPYGSNTYVREAVPQKIIENDRMAAQIAYGKDTVGLTGDRITGNTSGPGARSNNIDHFPNPHGPVVTGDQSPGPSQNRPKLDQPSSPEGKPGAPVTGDQPSGASENRPHSDLVP